MNDPSEKECALVPVKEHRLPSPPLSGLGALQDFPSPLYDDLAEQADEAKVEGSSSPEQAKPQG